MTDEAFTTTQLAKKLHQYCKGVDFAVDVGRPKRWEASPRIQALRKELRRLQGLSLRIAERLEELERQAPPTFPESVSLKPWKAPTKPMRFSTLCGEILRGGELTRNEQTILRYAVQQVQELTDLCLLGNINLAKAMALGRSTPDFWSTEPAEGP